MCTKSRIVRSYFLKKPKERIHNIWEGERSCPQAPVQNMCLFFSFIKINQEISNHLYISYLIISFVKRAIFCPMILKFAMPFHYKYCQFWIGSLRSWKWAMGYSWWTTYICPTMETLCTIFFL